jgi:hypothetical protein
MVRIVGALAVGLALSLVSPAAAAGPCDHIPPRSHVIHTSSFAKVYFTRGSKVVSWKACVLRSGRRYRLVDSRGPDVSSPGQHVAGTELAGRYVAWVVVRGSGDGPWTPAVQVFDLRKGKTRFVRSGPDRPMGYAPLVDAMAFNRAGRGAVLFHFWRPEMPDNEQRPTEERELVAVDAGPERILDRGVGISPDSVRIAGFTAHWVNHAGLNPSLRYADLY